ncbi:MAG: hypothetical protein ACYC7A_11435 [Thermoanaerobaculia bacterium]
MTKKWTWRNLASDDDVLQLGVAVNRPGVELAERVGRFVTPYEYLIPTLGGFADSVRFLLNRTLINDPDAIDARENYIALMRRRRLCEPYQCDRDVARDYLRAHHDEFMTFCREYYPWVFAAEWAGAEIHEPDPDTDALLDHHICGGLAEYGFTTKTRKCNKSYWRCHSSLLSRRMTIEFDKGRIGTNLSGELRIDDIAYSVSLADPFLFSGCVFYASTAQQLPVQMERFFGEYLRIFPHVVIALESAIAAANEVLATATKRSVS